MPCRFLISVATLILSLTISPACRPTQNPPPRPPPDIIQANAVVQGFMQALRDSDWAKAIGYCSAAVANDAKAYPSPEAFFRDVVPITPLVTQTKDPIYEYSEGKNGPWVLSALACQVAKLEPDPAGKWPVMAAWEIWWQGRVKKADDARWVVDFPTTPIKSHIEKRLAELRSARDKAIATETELEPKLKGLHTRLAPLARRVQAGGPMLFRLELINDGPANLSYSRSQVGSEYSFIVKTSQGNPATPTPSRPFQSCEKREVMVINPGETVVLLDKWDLATRYRLTQPGHYTVQFRGVLGIAEADPHKTVRIDPPRGIETQPAAGKRSLRLFPSNIVEIEVVTSQTANSPREGM